MPKRRSTDLQHSHREVATFYLLARVLVNLLKADPFRIWGIITAEARDGLHLIDQVLHLLVALLQTQNEA